MWGPHERTIHPCPWRSLPPQLLQMLGSCVAWSPVHLLLITQMVTVDRIFSQDCGAVVASKFFPIDGPDGKQQPLCERDYFRRLNLICAKCGLALRGSYVTACGKYLLSKYLRFHRLHGNQAKSTTSNILRAPSVQHCLAQEIHIMNTMGRFTAIFIIPPGSRINVRAAAAQS